MSLKSRIASLFGLGQQPQTQEYVAWPTGMWHVHAQQQRPIFNAYWADLMQFDHQVAFGLSICNAPVLKAQVEVKSKSREIGQFVEKQWKKIWAQDAVRVLHAKCYGAMGYEVCYEVCDGRIEFLSLLDRHPRDTYPLVGKPGTPWAGRVVGLRIRSLKSPTDSTGIPPLARPKCLWLTYDAQHGSRWGRAILERAFGAWYERSGEGGAIEKRKLRMMKDAWVGDVMKYPLSGPFARITMPNGTTVPSSELAREAVENRMSGAVLALPSDTDDKGNPYFDYKEPTSVQGVSPILEYIKELDYDIFDGLGLPREVVEAASTGSGFSGRSIPFVAFLATRDIEFADDVRQIKSQVIDPMIVANFGHEAIKDYELEPVPLIETVGELMGPMGQPNTTTANPQQPPQMPEGDGEPMQFAMDFDEADHPRNDDGTFKKKLADAYQMHRRYDWKSIYEDAAGENVTLADDLWNRFEGDTDRMDRLAKKLARESGYAGKYDGWEHSKEHAAELVEMSKSMPVEEVAALDKEAAEMLIAGKKPGQIVSHYLQKGEAHKVLRLPSILGPYRRNYAFTERIKREMPIEKPIEQDGDKALASLSDEDIASIQESDPAGTHHPFYAAAEHVLQSVPLSIDWRRGYRDGLGFELAKSSQKEAKRAVMGLWKQLPEDQQDETYGAQADADTVLESILSRHVAAANKAGERTDTAALGDEVLGMLRDGKSEAEIVDAIAASDQPWRVLALGDVYDSAKVDYEQELEDRKQAEEDAAAEAAEEVEEEPEEEPEEDEPEDDEETIQFALDDRPQTGSLPQKSESLAEKAARQQADRLRRSLRQLAEKTKADGGSLIAEVDGLLREFEPQLAEGIYHQWLAGWLGGAEEALSGLPPIETTGEPIRLPPIPPVAPPLIGNLGDDGEVVFPALDRALKSLANKRAVTRETFDAMTAQAREHAFTVAGGLRESAVEKIRDLLTKEIEEGPSLKGFADRVSAAFGRSPLGASHLETVYRAALSSSYSRGVESVLALPMVEDEFPYRLYVPIHDARARDEHTKLEKLGLDGTAVYHRDDPTWKKFQPPWDYGCRCGWIALTIQDASRRGVKHAKQWLENIREAKAKGMYDGQAISQMPPVEFVEPPPFEPSPDWRR